MQNSSLPDLVASRNWDAIDDTGAAHRLSYPQAQAQSHSRHSSSQSTTTDSSPVSLTFSSRGRSSGSASSLSSTPPRNDHLETPTPRKALPALPALPGVAEDPMERDGFHGRPDVYYSVQNSPTTSSRRGSRDFSWQRPNSFYSSRLDFEDYFHGRDVHAAKRRKSGDTATNSFATRIVERFPSFSKRQRKRASTSVAESRGENSPSFLSRSSSFRRSLMSRSQEHVGHLAEPHVLPSPIETIVEDDSRDVVMSSPPIDTSLTDSELEEPEELLIRSSTPLLPPLMDALREREPIQSPLISPTVAAQSKPASGSNTPTATPQISHSPTLTAQASNSSFGRSRATTLVSSSQSEVPPLVISDHDDEWADRLGHANYYILPEPYMPDYFDLHSCKSLLLSWELARSEFAKHLARTEAHFGPSSRTYKVTLEKWASIDAQWKRNSDEAARRAAENGATPYPIIPIEPAPVPQIPTIDDSRLLSGSDMNMVGPMAQVKPQVHSKPSKRAQLMKMFGIQTHIR